MRCPKCGYISFDHVETCLKCKKDISGKVEVVGTTYHAVAPSFLKIPSSSAANDEGDFENEFVPDMPGQDEEGYEFSDPDLDVLAVGDDEATISFDDPNPANDDSDFQLEADEDIDDEGSFEFDLDDDEGDLDGDDFAAPELNVSGELADISDLAAPAAEAVDVADSGDMMSLSADDEMSFDDDLDLSGLDLDLGLGGSEESTDSELSLSLDDIDISAEDLADDDIELDGLSMDLDLDLGDSGDIAQKNTEKKSDGGLGDISLSLD